MYSRNMQLSKAMLFILRIFIDYGLTLINNMFVHEYWYNPKIRGVRTLPSRFYMHYYKRHYYSHETLGIEHTFLIRHKTGEYFPLRT